MSATELKKKIYKVADTIDDTALLLIIPDTAQPLFKKDAEPFKQKS